MFEIKVNVDAPEVAAALNNLATAIHNLTVEKEVPQTAEPSETLQTAASQHVTEEAAESKPEEGATPQHTEPAVEQAQPETSTPQKTVTLDELSRAGAALIDEGKMSSLVNLLAEYNVMAITQLDPRYYPAFIERLKALGAKF